MCRYKGKVKSKRVEGYKIVLKHNETGDYYSIATGDKYHKKGQIVSFVQAPILNYFDPILSGVANEVKGLRTKKQKIDHLRKRPNFHYSPAFVNMHVGRTAIFVNKMEAEPILSFMIRTYKKQVRGNPNLKNFKICVVKAALHGEIYYGTYGDAVTYMAEIIEFLE